MIRITLKSARDWYSSLSDDELRAERCLLARMSKAGMADGADRRIVDAELARRNAT